MIKHLGRTTHKHYNLKTVNLGIVWHSYNKEWVAGLFTSVCAVAVSIDVGINDRGYDMVSLVHEQALPVLGRQGQHAGDHLKPSGNADLILIYSPFLGGISVSGL